MGIRGVPLPRWCSPAPRQSQPANIPKPSSSFMAQDIPNLSQIFSQTFVDNCLLLAGITTLTCDYLSTLNEEISYAWSCPWSLGLVLFYLNRYLAFVDQFILLYIKIWAVSSEACIRLYGVALATIAVGLLSSQIIISLRTCGMWGRRRWVMVVLGAVLSIAVIFAICITTYQIKTVTIETTPIGYIPLQSPTLILLVFVFVVMVESTIGALTVIRAYHFLKRASSVWVRQLYNSGILYCLCMVSLSVANILLICIPSVGGFRTVLIYPTRVVHSIFGNRVMLLILQQRYYVLQQLQNANAEGRSTTSPGFLTTVGLDWEWDTVRSRDIQLHERPVDVEERICIGKQGP